MSALKTVSDEIIEKARAQGFEIAPWFERSQSRLRAATEGLRRILKRLPILDGESDHARAAWAHGYLRRTLERLRPQEEAAWLDRNRSLLLSIGSVISGEQRMVAAIQLFIRANLPSTGLIHDYYKPERTTGWAEAKSKRKRKPKAATAKRSVRTTIAHDPMRSVILDEIRSLSIAAAKQSPDEEAPKVVLSDVEAEELASLFAAASAEDTLQ